MVVVVMDEENFMHNMYVDMEFEYHLQVKIIM
jgi:hypothetical protein